MNKLAYGFIGALALFAAVPAEAIPGTISTEADRKSGDIKWQPRARSYVLSYKKGKTDVTAEFPIDDVVKLDIAKPVGYDAAVDLVAKGQGAAAIGSLKKIVDEYRMMVWDKPAGRYLVLAYIAANQNQKAYDTCKAIVDEDKTAAYTGELAPAWWQALLKTGKTTQLEAVLKKATTSGDRAAACAAASMRGDIILADGENADNLKKALREGYLKASLMYQDVGQERQVAMLKAATCFEKLGQASRAEKLRNQAKSL